MRHLLAPDPPRQGLDWIDGHLAELASLSAGELTVLRSLAHGATNAAIAAELCLSERTVESHVGSIFAKLGLPQRPDENRRVIAAVLWFRALA